MKVLLAVDGAAADRLADELDLAGIEAVGRVGTGEVVSAAADPASGVWEALRAVDALVLQISRAVLVPDVVAMCDRNGVRIIALAERAADRRLAAAFGLPAALGLDVSGDEIADIVRSRIEPAADDDRERGVVTVCWGPHGAPGRSTIAAALASARARAGRRVALVDADAHAPSLAQALGLPDDAPGFPAACRQVDYGVLDAPELTRLSVPLDVASGTVEVLTGINRPARWPELTGDRVEGVLAAARGWVDEQVVDVAASLERDEEIVSDLDGPRRNQATLAALASADRVVAVAAADPVGLARFVRGFSQLREHVPSADVTVVVNRMRSGPFGVDGRGQVRRALERLAGVGDVVFLPDDRRAVDSALFDEEPVLRRRRRAGLGQAIEHLAATL